MSTTNKDKEFHMTTEELDKFEKAMKNEEFRKLLVEYAQEISDPENKKKYEEEIAQMERERGVDVKFVNPEGGFVVKTTQTRDGTKAFINICYNQHIDKANSHFTEKEEGGKRRKGQQWSLPYSLSQPRDDLDRAGVKCVVYDAVFHPETYNKCQEDKQFKKMVIDTAVDGIEKQFNVKLNRKNLKFPKMKFKGMKQATVIRNKSKEAGSPTADITIGDKRFPYPYGDGPALVGTEPGKESKKIGNQTGLDKNGKDLSKANKACDPVEPEHHIVHRGVIDFQNFTNARDSCTSTRPNELLVYIDLPLLKSTGTVELDVFEKHLVLTNKEPPYHLDLALPYPVDEQNGCAKFDKSKHQLVVTLRVLLPPPEIDIPREEHGLVEQIEHETEETEQPVVTLPSLLPPHEIDIPREEHGLVEQIEHETEETERPVVTLPILLPPHEIDIPREEHGPVEQIEHETEETERPVVTLPSLLPPHKIDIPREEHGLVEQIEHETEETERLVVTLPNLLPPHEIDIPREEHGLVEQIEHETEEKRPRDDSNHTAFEETTTSLTCEEENNAIEKNGAAPHGKGQVNNNADSLSEPSVDTNDQNVICEVGACELSAGAKTSEDSSTDIMNDVETDCPSHDERFLAPDDVIDNQAMSWDGETDPLDTLDQNQDLRFDLPTNLSEMSSPFFFKCPCYSYHQDQHTLTFVIHVTNVALEDVSLGFNDNKCYISFPSGPHSSPHSVPDYSLYVMFAQGQNLAPDLCHIDITEQNVVVTLHKDEASKGLWDSFRAGPGEEMLQDKFFVTENNVEIMMKEIADQDPWVRQSKYDTDLKVTALSEESLTLELESKLAQIITDHRERIENHVDSETVRVGDEAINKRVMTEELNSKTDMELLSAKMQDTRLSSSDEGIEYDIIATSKQSPYSCGLSQRSVTTELTLDSKEEIPQSGKMSRSDSMDSASSDRGDVIANAVRTRKSCLRRTSSTSTDDSLGDELDWCCPQSPNSSPDSPGKKNVRFNLNPSVRVFSNKKDKKRWKMEQRLKSRPESIPRGIGSQNATSPENGSIGGVANGVGSSIAEECHGYNNGIAELNGDRKDSESSDHDDEVDWTLVDKPTQSTLSNNLIFELDD